MEVAWKCRVRTSWTYVLRIDNPFYVSTQDRLKPALSAIDEERSDFAHFDFPSEQGKGKVFPRPSVNHQQPLRQLEKYCHHMVQLQLQTSHLNNSGAAATPDPGGCSPVFGPENEASAGRVAGRVQSSKDVPSSCQGDVT